MFTRVFFFIFLIISFNTNSKSLNHITTKTDGTIDKAIDVAISDDGQFVYVAGFSNGYSKNDLVVFRRDVTNDTLSAVQFAPDSFSLLRVYELLLSSDQKNVYALEEDGDELSVLSRDSETGMLSEIQNIRSIDFPEANISDTTVLAESNDGNYILVSGGDLTISVFKREIGTGKLEFVNLYEIESNISFGYEVRDLKFSPISNSFYIAGPSGIAVFSFNESNGDISYLWSENGYKNDALSTIQSSWEIAVNEVNNDVYLASSSGLHVFKSNLDVGQLQLKQYIEIEALQHDMVAPRKIEINNGMLYLVVGEDNNFGSFEKNGIIQFDIDDSSGILTQVDAIFNGIDIELMHGPMDIEFSSSGEHAYVPSYVSGALLVFTRNELNGKLLYQTVTNAENGDRGITSPKNITASDDNKFLYVTDRFSGISVFEFSEQSESLKFIQNNSPYNYESGEFDTSLILSPDGKHIYLPENGTGAKIHLFERSNDTGKVTLTKTFNKEKNWINDFDQATSFVMSADGNYVYASHSNSKWLLTVFSRESTTGDLTLVERVQNNHYGNTEGIAEFNGAVYANVMPDNKHLLVYSNSSDLALFSIDQSTGKLTLKQLMENELFGVSKSRITSDAIGFHGNILYLPYETRNEYSREIDSGIIVAELSSESGIISQIHKYSSNEQSNEWLQGYVRITLDSNIGRIYLTKGNGDSFIALSINDTTKELSMLEEIELKGTVLKKLGEPQLVNTFSDGKYIVSVDSVNSSLSIFRKNTPPELNIDDLKFRVRVGEDLLIDFENYFSDFDNDLLMFEVVGNVPDWMNLEASYVDGNPSSTDLGTTFLLKVSDGVDKISTEVSVEVINEKNPPFNCGEIINFQNSRPNVLLVSSEHEGFCRFHSGNSFRLTKIEGKYDVSHVAFSVWDDIDYSQYGSITWENGVLTFIPRPSVTGPVTLKIVVTTV
ncbi:beta-propeller fold lactonase family protein, partial [Rheinheimera baltica]